MTARFEIVRTDAEQPWHARLVVGGVVTWHTENYARMVGAERAVLSLMRHVAGAPAFLLKWNVEGSEKVICMPGGLVLGYAPLVKHLDERGTP